MNHCKFKNAEKYSIDINDGTNNIYSYQKSFNKDYLLLIIGISHIFPKINLNIENLDIDYIHIPNDGKIKINEYLFYFTPNIEHQKFISEPILYKIQTQNYIIVIIILILIEFIIASIIIFKTSHPQ
jgi:hypothetical protein